MNTDHSPPPDVDDVGYGTAFALGLIAGITIAAAAVAMVVCK